MIKFHLTISSINRHGQLEIWKQKIKIGPLPYTTYKTKLRVVKDLNARSETTNQPEVYILEKRWTLVLEVILCMWHQKHNNKSKNRKLGLVQMIKLSPQKASPQKASPQKAFWAPKSLQMVTAAMKLKNAYSLEGKLWPT